MKIMFICRAFDNMAGGVERMAAILMNEMVRREHDVSLLTWDVGDSPSPFYHIDQKVDWFRLNMGDPNQAASFLLRLRRAIVIRKHVSGKKPDVIIGFQHGCFWTAKVSCLGMPVLFIAAERNAPSRMDFNSEGKKRKLIFQSFRLAHRVTIQCESYRDDYPGYLRSKIVAIPNPVFAAQDFAKPAGKNGQSKTLLCVARLSYQKNLQVLIEAFALIAGRHPEWVLKIAGEGESRPQLEGMIDQLQMKGKVILAGAVKDVSSLYVGSHLFCLPARWEGFPNALAEAMAHGLPAVGFAGCAGVRDLIMNEETGLLAQGNGDSETLARALDCLMADDEKRSAMGSRAVEGMRQYEPQAIFTAWEDLFLRAK
jgi:glycosyltransferase involved in cell wall biosynthesis